MKASSSSSSRVLYSFWISSCSWRIRFALNLKGLQYQYKSVDLYKGEQFTPEFEQINPLHYVPVLVDDGVVVSDSLAIFMYLEDKYPQNQLLPADPYRRALNLQAASIVSNSMQPLHMKSVMVWVFFFFFFFFFFFVCVCVCVCVCATALFPVLRIRVKSILGSQIY
ncbi:Glutathione S-transferase 1 [Bienertia sinuspersici]